MEDPGVAVHTHASRATAKMPSVAGSPVALQAAMSNFVIRLLARPKAPAVAPVACIVVQE
jgi:hypothetical protein